MAKDMRLPAPGVFRWQGTSGRCDERAMNERRNDENISEVAEVFSLGAEESKTKSETCLVLLRRSWLFLCMDVPKPLAMDCLPIH